MKKHNPSKDTASVCIWSFDASHFLLTSVKKNPMPLLWIQAQKQRFDRHFFNLDWVALRLSEDAFLIEGAPQSCQNKLRTYKNS